MSINVSFRLLKAFALLVEQKSFTRAAGLCHVSQSSFSSMIQRLEESVGARLFDRDTRNVVLTPEGERFAETVADLIGRVEWVFSDLQDYVNKKKGRVRIAALPSIAGSWLPARVIEYRGRYPGIEIEIFDVLSDRCMLLLRQGLVDMALAAPGMQTDEFMTEPFHTDQFFFVCQCDHPMAGRTQIALADLQGLDFIRLAPTTSVDQHSADALAAAGIGPARFEVENLATVAGLVVNGLGVSLLPELTLPLFAHPGLTAIPLVPPGISRPIHIMWRKDKPLSIAAQAMLDLVRSLRPVSL